VLVLVLVIAVLLKAVADLVLDYADQAREIGHVTSPQVVPSGRGGQVEMPQGFARSLRSS